MRLSITIASGKGGTGKTFVSTNLARVLDLGGQKVRYLDCDVEEPNGHLFLRPEIISRKDIALNSPSGVKAEACIGCGKCIEACNYNALSLINGQVLFFNNLCHVCGACGIVCPADAIIEGPRKIGELHSGLSGGIEVHFGLLKTGEGGMSPRLIKQVKEKQGEGISLLDSSPGTSCPVVETVKDADLCVLVTDPTPFGIHDLKLAVEMCRELGKEPLIVVNRAEYHNGDLKSYCAEAGLEILGEIPEERRAAECYSRGGLVVEEFPEYRRLFEDMARRLLEKAKKIRPILGHTKNPFAPDKAKPEIEKPQSTCSVGEQFIFKGKEIVVISGKGGTGKTSLTASFCALEKKAAAADCDVDAADLHLLLNPRVRQSGSFSGGRQAVIAPDKCSGCGDCAEACRFGALGMIEQGSEKIFQVDSLACEGCGVCGLVCREGAVSFQQMINGSWYLSETDFGPLAHAKLGIAEENSGKLVSLIRRKKHEQAARENLQISISDGSPGTGCPVISSITGADYVVIVTEPTVSGIHDLARILDLAQFFKLPAGVIVNKYDLNPEKTKEIEIMSLKRDTDFLGTLAYDKAFTRSQMAGVPLVEFERSPLTETIRHLWQQIKGKVLMESSVV